jgi:putative membrane-bound dehydrogenase-like protein
MRLPQVFLGCSLLVAIGLACGHIRAEERLSILFLGDQGHHHPQALAEAITPVLEQNGIDVTYTEDLQQLNLEHLKGYSGLLLYANIDELPAAQERDLLQYVAEGGGFIPLHCASYCFRNSTAFVDLVGAQFQRHGGQIFSTQIVQPEHPIMRGFEGFTSWDETYIHTHHNPRNRIVLEARSLGEQADGQTREPWTWVRTQGQGRVFYTAWGHDQRTWNHPGFQNLLLRGVRWACGADPAIVPAYREAAPFIAPAMTAQRTDVAPFEYEEVGPKIPNYIAGEKWGTQGEIKTQMQRPLSPAESLKHYVVPQGFHLELFAAEPDFQGKPIAMNWDERGRLWVCETLDYPNELQPIGQGRDRIRICEDTDQDGRADKFTVFAEQLSIPTAIEFCRGGVIVQDGTVTLFLRDNDGDDRADERVELITGWALGDTHGGVSNFQYGLDNQYWAMQGYNDSKPQYAGGKHPGFRQGPFRFQTGTAAESGASALAADARTPNVQSVEFIRSTTNNSWGLGSSEEGLIFASTANRAPSFFVPIANRYYERVRGWTPGLLADAIAPDHLFHPITDKVRQVDHHGGYTAGAGHALYTARTYPRSWWNRLAFVCGPTGHLVGTYVLHRQGATYRDANEFNLVASDDEWSAPIMAEVGPDGNMWILDWYNYIVQHNPTPQGFTTGKGNAYESDLRDKKHGRIYRLVYDGDEGEPGAEQAPMLAQATPTELVAALQHPNRLWRRHAQRLLVERGDLDVVPALVELLQDRNVDETGNNAGVIHALWTLHGLQAGQVNAIGQVPAELQRELLAHPAAGVRRNALLTLPASPRSIQWIVASDLVHDSDAQVQLAALLALADMPADPQAGAELARLCGESKLLQDRFLKDAIICASAKHARDFLTAVLQTAAKAAPESDEVLRVVAEHAARSGMEGAELATLLKGMSQGSPAQVAQVAEGLAAGWPKSLKVSLPPEADEVLKQLCQKASPGQLSPLLRLGAAWGSTHTSQFAEALIDALMLQIEDPSAADRERVAAANELVSLVGDSTEVVARMLAALSPQMTAAVATGLIRSLTDATAENVASEMLELWPSLTPALRGDGLAVLLARPERTRFLLDAISNGKIAFTELSLDQRRTLENHPDKGISELAKKLASSAGVVVDADRQRIVDSYAAAAEHQGNVEQGKLLFTKNCANCHKHSGEGQEVGPDLTGMAVHPKHELLIHILDPNRSVEGNFRRYTLLTTDGQVLTGMLAGESQAAIELVDAEGKRQSISREDIEQLTSTQLSLMPAGFEQQLPLADMTNLLEFLTNKGRFVPLPLASVASAVSSQGLFSDSDDGPDRIVFADWGPKEFAGVPFQLVDPLGKRRANIVLLNGPRGSLPPKMPSEVSLPCNMLVKRLHLLGGISGWGFPFDSNKSTSMIVRLHYADGQTEDHPLLNGVHMADYIRRVDVPKSQFAFDVNGQQVRYLSIEPARREPIASIDLIKGDDATAPIIVAITAEGDQQ